MITHHPSLVRSPPVAVPPGVRLRLAPHAFPSTAAAPPPTLSVRLRPLRAAAGGASRVGGDGGRRERPPPMLGAAVLGFARSNFLPLALVGGIILALLDPTLGCIAHKYSLSKYSSFGIFVISGLTLRTEELGAAIEAWPAGLFGLVSILLFTPFLAQVVMKVQFYPHEFITGKWVQDKCPLFLFSPVFFSYYHPGISCCHVIVGGNSALALAMTVTSNLLGVITVPLSLAKYIGAGAGVMLPTAQLFKSLVTRLLIPLIIGKVIRETSKGVADFVDRNRQGLSISSAFLLSVVPWIQVSRSRSLILSVPAKAIAAAVIVGVLLHLVLLAFNVTILQILSRLEQKGKSVFARKEYARAVILVASQKTLPVLVAVVEQLGGALGEPGFLVIPCVAAHINQIIIDSFIVNWWRKRDRQFANANHFGRKLYRNYFLRNALLA